jgi:HAD superfamily hydrolase (TIGR01509 family)
VIFDMDGLLVDSESLAMEALAAAAADAGLDLPAGFFHLMIGLPADQCRTLMLDRLGADFPTEPFFAAAEARKLELVRDGRLTLKPGALELLSLLERRGTPKAVATSSGRAKARHHLEAVGIAQRFAAVVTRDDVARGKPYPDLYLAAAGALGIGAAAVPRAGGLLQRRAGRARRRRARGHGARPTPPTDEMRAACVAVVGDLLAVGPLLPSTTGPHPGAPAVVASSRAAAGP